VYVFNQRDVAGIQKVIRTLGRLVDESDRADALAASYEAKIRAIQQTTSAWRVKPKVYFEEWYDAHHHR
jgi:iron complex transport system substrate-binding protein